MFEQLSDNQLYILIRALNTERNLLKSSWKSNPILSLEMQLVDVDKMYNAACLEDENRVSRAYNKLHTENDNAS